jgi:hypothetical protein
LFLDKIYVVHPWNSWAEPGSISDLHVRVDTGLDLSAGPLAADFLSAEAKLQSTSMGDLYGRNPQKMDVKVTCLEARVRE